MNENLFRPQFDTLKLSDKLWLMQTLATRYNLTFKELYAFSRWRQSCTTGLFEKGGREFVFVPGDTVILGWEGFIQGMDKANQEELADIFAEIEYEGTAEEFLRQGMTPVRQMTIGPMFVGRKLEEIGWESVPMNDPRITAHPEWLENLQRWAGQDSQSFEIHETVRFERNADSWRAWLCHPMTYPEFQRSLLWELAASLPTPDEWAYLCGGGCRTLFPWGDGLDHKMKLHHFCGATSFLRNSDKIYEKKRNASQAPGRRFWPSAAARTRTRSWRPLWTRWWPPGSLIVRSVGWRWTTRPTPCDCYCSKWGGM